jgi:hypothetical protein
MPQSSRGLSNASILYWIRFTGWEMGDGLKLPIEQRAEFEVQLCHYNGWYKYHCMTSLLVFTPDGRIIAFILNS